MPAAQTHCPCLPFHPTALRPTALRFKPAVTSRCHTLVAIADVFDLRGRPAEDEAYTLEHRHRQHDASSPAPSRRHIDRDNEHG